MRFLKEAVQECADFFGWEEKKIVVLKKNLIIFAS